jgi:hypothetical protein
MAWAVIAMIGIGCWILDSGCWILDSGYWMLDIGYLMFDTGFLIKLKRVPQLKQPGVVKIDDFH